MSTQTDTDIQKMVAQLMIVYGKKSSKEECNMLIAIWQKALAKLNTQELRVGFQNLMKTRVKSGMPTPAEFYSALYNDILEDALMAWNQLFQALKSHPGRPICFMDFVLAETCRRMGGLTFFGSLSSSELSFQRKSFMDTYSILAKQGDTFDPVCHGTYVAEPIEMETMASRRSVTGDAL